MHGRRRPGALKLGKDSRSEGGAAPAASGGSRGTYKNQVKQRREKDGKSDKSGKDGASSAAYPQPENCMSPTVEIEHSSSVGRTQSGLTQLHSTPGSGSRPTLRERRAVSPLGHTRTNSPGNLAINVQGAAGVSASGTFVDGDLALNRDGIRIGGERPVSRGRADSRSESRGRKSRGSEANESVDDEEDIGGQVSLGDLEKMRVLGAGAAGVVVKVKHKSTGRIMALKRIPMDSKAQKSVVIELRTLLQADCPQIVGFWDAFYAEGSVHILLEHMDAGSLGDILKLAGPMPEPVLSYLIKQVLLGLVYLHKKRHIVHLDIKPSNLLVNTDGEVKVADFGVSRQLANSVAQAMSWVGTTTHMSPERIRGDSYSMDTDIWSVGLVVFECACGRFPYPPPGEKIIGFMDLLDYIVEKPVPLLPETGSHSLEVQSFVAACLRKVPSERPSAMELLKHPFITKYEKKRKVERAAVEWIKAALAKKPDAEADYDAGGGVGSAVNDLQELSLY